MEPVPVWEMSKENAAPLERGRNIKALERSLINETPEEREEKERMVRHYEKLVRPSERGEDESDDDPLIHWLSYIKFHQEAFPSDTHAQFLLMERCTRALVHRKQYANDVRFLRVCVTYADKTSFPGDVFKYLHQQKVGCHTALFWVAWAWVAENKGDYAFAEKVFLKGINKEAKPMNMIKQRHKQFQRRMSRHWLNTTATAQDEDGDEVNPTRGALGGLSEEAARLNNRSSSNHPSSRQRQSRPSNVSTFADRSADPRRDGLALPNNGVPMKGGFEIFVEDTGSNDDYNLDQSHAYVPREMAREVDRKKENSLAAERWNERGGLGTNSYSVSAPVHTRPLEPPAGPSFAVFVDDECAAKLERAKESTQIEADRARRDRDERTLRQRADEGVAEKLARDPMRYVRNPSKLASDQAQGGEPLRDQKHVKEAKDTNTEGAVTCGFNKKLLKDANGQEQCFEEGRAHCRFYRLVNSVDNFNLLAISASFNRSLNDSAMEVDDNNSIEEINMEDVTTDERKRPLPPASSRTTINPRKVLFAADTSFESQNHSFMHNASYASSTVDEREAVGVPAGKEEETINTKLAMKELSMMFSSPAFGLEKDSEPARKVRRSSESEDADNEDTNDGDTATFSIVEGLVRGDIQSAIDNSFLAATAVEIYDGYVDTNDENRVPRNLAARSNSTPGFHDCALRDLQSDDRIVLGGRPGHDEQTDVSGGGFQIYSDDGSYGTQSVANLAARSVIPTSLNPFQIYEDDEEGDDIDDKRISGGDTATFSVFGEAMKSLDEGISSPVVPRGGISSNGGFSIYMDEDESINDTKTGDFQNYGPGIAHTVLTEDPPGFGDISHIAPDEGDVSCDRRHVVASAIFDTLGPKGAIEYNSLHQNDIRAALRHLQLEARKLAISDSARARDQNLSRMLSTKGHVYDLQNQFLPRALQRKSSTQGSEISVGQRTGIVREELGRGSYAVVILMDSDSEAKDEAVIAVKAQSPTDCLAWEYTVLEKIEERIGKQWDISEGKFPYPRPLSFVSLADGSLLGMTAGSKSGMNLVDLVNVYKVTERSPVPELVALHYTVRMLKHIEALHWHGKILHCDVKPDNWVITESSTAINTCQDIVEASDLMLVDFGRAVDLTVANRCNSDPMDVKLRGEAAAQDMACVAMRKGLGWSFDVDTFGLCASAHVLLYGCHLEIEMDANTNRWRQRKPLRRYWKKEIWTELFDTLLNLDEMGKTAIGSRPRSLRCLRDMMKEYLQNHNKELESLLKHQARILPATRPR